MPAILAVDAQSLASNGFGPPTPVPEPSSPTVLAAAVAGTGLASGVRARRANRPR